MHFWLLTYNQNKLEWWLTAWSCHSQESCLERYVCGHVMRVFLVNISLYMTLSCVLSLAL